MSTFEALPTGSRNGYAVPSLSGKNKGMGMIRKKGKTAGVPLLVRPRRAAAPFLALRRARKTSSTAYGGPPSPKGKTIT